MSGKLASSFFTSGPLDELLSLDVYTALDSGVKSTLFDKAATLGMDAVDVVRNNVPELITDFGDMVSITDGAVGFDKDALKERIFSLAGDLKGPFTELAAGVQTTVLDTLGISSETGGDIRAVIGDSISLLQSTDVKDARSLFGALESITGVSSFGKLFDLEAEFALFGGILSEGIRLGIPDVFDVLATKFSNDRVAQRVFLKTLLQAAMSSDLASVEKIIDKIGVAAALAQVPNLVEVILMAYTAPRRDGYVAASVFTGTLTGLLTKIDSQWWRYNRNGNLITNIGVFTYASPDALLALSYDPALLDATLIARNFPATQLIPLAQRNYPLAALVLNE